MTTTNTPEELRRLYISEFLNSHGRDDLGAVLAEIRDGDQAEEYLDFGATLQIQEAASSVSLDFGVFGMAETDEDRQQLREDLEAARLKAARLKGAVFLFIENLEKALGEVEANLDARDLKASKKG